MTPRKPRYCRLCGKLVGEAGLNPGRIEIHKSRPMIRCEASDRLMWYWTTTDRTLIAA